MTPKVNAKGIKNQGRHAHVEGRQRPLDTLHCHVKINKEASNKRPTKDHPHHTNQGQPSELPRAYEII